MSHRDHPVDQSGLLNISAADFSRWETVGQRFEHMAPELLQELAAMRSNPTKHNFYIAANAARLAAQLAGEPLKTEELALAEELEGRSV